jgi:uncharacterized protein
LNNGSNFKKKQEGKYLNNNLILNTLKELEAFPHIIEHCKVVSRKAMEISSNFDDVNTDLVKTGALLHDIGRSRTQGIKHGILGAEILQEKGFPVEVQKIAERHIGAGIPKNEAKILGLPVKDYMPLTLEEKIVAHADNLTSGTKEVDIDFVIQKWEKRLEKDHPSIGRILKLDSELGSYKNLEVTKFKQF